MLSWSASYWSGFSGRVQGFSELTTFGRKHIISTVDAGWSSLEARRAHNPEVIGSNPIPATFAQLAQLVEQRTENPCVFGSIPKLGISI